MKFNLKNRPVKSTQQRYEEWIKGLEKELREKLEGIEFVLNDSPQAPWFLGVKDTIKEILGE